MKRFYREARAAPLDQGWHVQLDGRPLKTQAGNPQIVPSRLLAEALAAEWAAQGDEIDPAGFVLRDLADHAIDVAGPERPALVTDLLRYAETDTLCYRAEPGEPLLERQEAVWEPLLSSAEQAYGVRFERIGGVIHRPQPAATLARMRTELEAHDAFAIAALLPLTTLSASLVIGLTALRGGTEPATLWDAANLEEDWQAEQWGIDSEAAQRRARRLGSFAAAARFAALARG